MAEPSPTVVDLFKRKAAIDDDVSWLVRAVLYGARDRASLADGYAVDLRAAVAANDFAMAVLTNPDSKPGTRHNAARTAILWRKWRRHERPRHPSLAALFTAHS